MVQQLVSDLFEIFLDLGIVFLIFWDMFGNFPGKSIKEKTKRDQEHLQKRKTRSRTIQEKLRHIQENQEQSQAKPGKQKED